MKFLGKAAALAVAGLFLPQLVHAQVPVTFTDGDLVIGFRASGGQGSDKAYLVNVGKASDFAAATGASSISVGDIATDLSDTFGATWSTRNNLFWSGAAVPSTISTVGNDPAKTIYVTKVQETPGQLNSTPWLRQVSATQAAPAAKITAFGRAYGTVAGVPNTSTTHSDFAIVQDNSATNSYASFQAGGSNAGPAPGISFAYFNPTTEGSFANGAAGSVLELYRLVPGATANGQLVGFFTITAGGDLSFFPASTAGNPNVAGGNATVQFQLGTYSVSESGGTLTAKVIRGGNLSNSFSVDVTAVDDTAVAGTDFGTFSSTVNFAAGQTEATVTLNITNRPGPQGNRAFKLHLSNATASTAAGGDAVVNITEPAGAFSFSAVSSTVTPTLNGGPRNIQVTVVRTGAAGGIATVDVSKTGGTILNTEFSFTSPATVSFANGQVSKTVSFQLNAIPPTLTRTVELSLGNATGGAVTTAPTTTTINITKKDAAAPVLTLVPPTLGADGSFSISGTVKDALDLDSVVATLGSEVITASVTGFAPGVATPFTAGTFHAQNGANTLIIQAKDSSGNTATLTKAITFVNSATYTAQAGTYTGILLPEGTAANEKAGFVTVTVTATGVFTGKATVNGSDIVLGGLFLNNGNARFKDNTTAFKLVDIVEFPTYLGTLKLNLQGSVLTGELDEQAGGTKLATLDASKSTFNATTNPVDGSLLNAGTKGNYTVAIPSKAQGALATSLFPQGDGAATLTLTSAGAVTLKGTLADGTALSATGVLRSNNSVALFSKLYKNRGVFLGKASFNLLAADSDIAGTDLLWIRPAVSRSQYYPAGWETGLKVDVVGAKYAGVASVDFGQGNDNFTIGNASLVFNDGLLGSAVTKGVNVNKTTGAVKTIPATNAPYTLAFTASTGLFSGIFPHTDNSKPAYKGVLLNKGANKGGFGFFLSTPAAGYNTSGQSGSVNLNP